VPRRHRAYGEVRADRIARGLAVVSLLAIVVATVTPCSARTAHGAVLLVALAVSVSIETIQFLALSRIASTDDVILNVGDSVVGACLGSSIAHSGWGLGLSVREPMRQTLPRTTVPAARSCKA
jgi:hypothetical protein